MKLTIVLLVALYSYNSNADTFHNRTGLTLPNGFDPSDSRSFKCFDIHQLGGKPLNPFDFDANYVQKRFAAKYKRKYSDSELESTMPNIHNCLINIAQRIIECFKDPTQGTYTVGLTPLCDKSAAELQNIFGAKVDDTAKKASVSNRRKYSYGSASQCIPTTTSTLPTSYDCRSYGLVTPVKDQQQCGSCWAFASTATIESQLLKLHAGSQDLSEQDLVNCASSSGCDGDSIDTAYNFVINNGQATEAAVPYTGTVGTCNHCPLIKGYKITDYCSFGPPNSDSIIMRTVKEKGSVVVLLDATDLASGGYTSGVYNNPNCTTSLNHAVELIGWGTQRASGSTPAIDYWIMKNSWGTSWGEKGYFRMKRSVNMCGINEYYYFPILTAANAKSYSNNTCSIG